MVEDIEHDNLLGSVIVETVKMVVSKPIQIPDTVEGSHSSLQNFKKFKRVKTLIIIRTRNRFLV